MRSEGQSTLPPPWAIISAAAALSRAAQWLRLRRVILVLLCVLGLVSSVAAREEKGRRDTLSGHCLSDLFYNFCLPLLFL